MKRDKIIKQVDKLVAKGNLEKAAPLLQQLVDADPKDWNAINRLGDIYARLGDNKRANEMYTRIAAHFAEDGFNLKAIAMFKKVLKLDPNHLDAYDQLGQLYKAQGLNNEARTNYQVLADHYTKAGNSSKAREVYAQLAEMEPGNAQIRLKLADMLIKEGQKDEALQEYLSTGKELMKQGMMSEANEVFEKALDLDSGNVDLMRMLAESYSELDQHDKAISFLQGLVEKNPDSLDLQNVLGECYVKAGRIGEAEELFQKVIEKDPKAVSGVINMSRLLLQRGDAAGAFDHYAPIIGELKSEDRTDEVLAFLQEILKVEGDHIPTLKALVDVGTDAGLDDKARASHMSRLAEAHVQAGQFEEAATILSSLTELEPDNSQHQEKLAFVRSKLTEDAPAETAEGAMVLEAEDDEAFVLGEDSEDSALEFSLEDEEPAPAEATPTTPDAAAKGARAAAAASGGDFVQQHMAEAEVFIKYGLMDKAVEQLQAIIERDPSNVEVHQKLKDLYMEEGLKDKAVEEMVTIAEIFRGQGEEDQAQDVLSEALTIDPNHARLQEALGDQEGPQAQEPAPAAAPAEAAADTAGGEGPSAEALEEVDFYISQDFKEEALELLNEMRGNFGDHPDIISRIQQCGAGEAAAASSESDEEVFAEEKEFFDLSSELSEELGEDIGTIGDDIQGRSIDELVGDIKKKVSEQVDEEDWETHYNLGIAYKEMGLIDEAISEFQHAVKDASRFLECCSLLGHCFIDKAMPQLAVQWYQRGLSAEGYGDEEMQNLRYELAALLESLGEKEQALEYYRELQDQNGSYRDVADKVKSLADELGK